MLEPLVLSDHKPDAAAQRGSSKKRVPGTAGRHWRWWLGGAALLALLTAALAYARYSVEEPADFQLNLPRAPEPAAFASALFQSVGARLRPGHQIEVLDNGAVFDALVTSIQAARSSVHVLMYIWAKGVASDRVLGALTERARHGVECRVLVDAFGSSSFSRELQPALEQAGCEVKLFRPVGGSADELERNHRKIVVIDGEVAFTGGLGIRDDWLGDGQKEHEWRDTHVRFRGPAVSEAQQAFAENWQEAGGALLPAQAFAASPASSAATRAAFVSSTAAEVTRAERLTQLMIGFARRRLWISNAYFVPSDAILTALGRKASEGVDVRVLVAGQKSDSKTSFGVQQFEYGALIDRGVRVWEYLPSMLHSKAMLVDDELGTIGSINLDPLSLNVLEEGALVVQDATFNERLARSFLADCSRAKELSEPR
jgi:cardiolipin synthase A/B